MEAAKPKKYIDNATALIKMQRYCAYQERSHQEVKDKLIELGVYGDRIDEIIVELIQENFLNEERFAKAFVRGKFNIKKWGKIRIKNELKIHRISAYCLKKGFEEIEDSVYFDTLVSILTKKKLLLNEEDKYKLRQKLFAYAQQKGYEIPLINEALNTIM
jgi:regulatory protein